MRWRSIIGRHLVQQSKNLEQELRRWAASRASREESHASGCISCRVSGEASRASGALGLLCSPTTLLESRAVTWTRLGCVGVFLRGRFGGSFAVFHIQHPYNIIQHPYNIHTTCPLLYPGACRQRKISFSINYVIWLLSTT